ncbi:MULTISPECIES: hypothetical protein [unclassified Bradyrhizobium]|uniref:hypothetical protein n=1 Tax=unclassified Bradyrhizobium TaxID=2631580 RepID=UPI002479AFC6|nr:MULTISPECIES: hypothetical protein [unclassified Bradyrhizobium]WGS21869.1 hypothetical protein MTX22_09340 [Bradyrhizobium sp. ISRA463]WGS28823.1 hypothetical protein MTX19_07165 [Bradyrhizobium sp. ISRA464]
MQISRVGAGIGRLRNREIVSGGSPRPVGWIIRRRSRWLQDAAHLVHRRSPWASTIRCILGKLGLHEGSIGGGWERLVDPDRRHFVSDFNIACRSGRSSRPAEAVENSPIALTSGGPMA